MTFNCTPTVGRHCGNPKGRGGNFCCPALADPPAPPRVGWGRGLSPVIKRRLKRRGKYVDSVNKFLRCESTPFPITHQGKSEKVLQKFSTILPSIDCQCVALLR